MAHSFKESDFQNGIFIPYLTAPQPGGLDWILGKPTDIDAVRWIVKGDLLHFLRAGCPLNAAALAKASKGYGSDMDFLQAFLAEALLPKIEPRRMPRSCCARASPLPGNPSCCGTKRRAPARIPVRRICSRKTICA